MKIHEFQAKQILKQHKINILHHHICFNLEEMLKAAKQIKYPCILKAQIYAGGRGKVGGIKIAHNKQDVINYYQQILNKKLVTHQTNSDGQLVNMIMIEELCDVIREFYIGLTIDREQQKICLIMSDEGGVDIEKTAIEKPHKLLKQWINPNIGLMPFQIRFFLSKLKLHKNISKSMHELCYNLYNMFIVLDLSLAEINPLIVTKNNELIALDAKFNIDDNALFRQSNILNMYDPKQYDNKEVLAHKYDISYVALNGNIGCMVNGAGLAMATMDIIKYVGGNPANFLDVGGSTTILKVTQALKLIMQDKNVKVIFINVFGGIAKCDTIANGVISASKDLNINIPLIVRLEGTNSKIAKQMLNNSKLNIITADNMLDGALKAVKASRI